MVKVKKGKGIISLVITVCMVFTMMTCFTGTADAATYPSLNDKSIYKVNRYVSGDCVLCANAYMLKRMAILLQTPMYTKISNDTLRGIASYDSGDGYVNDVYFNYSFTNKYDGIKFTVKHGYFSSGNQVSKLKELLKTHPEGIVVYDNKLSKGYPHAVLITGYNKSKGKFYCADSALNSNGVNKGITYYTDSIMDSIYNCDAYWYLSSTTLKKMSTPKVTKYNSSKVKVTYSDIYGQNRYQISKSSSKTGTYVVGTYITNVANPKYVTTKRNTTYYYKMRGYNRISYTAWDGTKKDKYVYGYWSAVKAYKLK